MERCVNTVSDTDFLHNNHSDCWQHPENQLGMFKFTTFAHFLTSFTYTNIVREDGKWEVQWNSCFFFHFMPHSRERSVQTASAQLITTFTLPLTKAVMTKQARPYSKHIVWLRGIMVDRVDQPVKMSNAFCFRFR